MKILSLILCFIVLLFTGERVFAGDTENILPVLKKIVAEDKTRFGIDVKKCRLECERVYSEDHCKAKCAEISSQLRSEGLERERVEKEQAEEQRAVKYPLVAEKYR